MSRPGDPGACEVLVGLLAEDDRLRAFAAVVLGASTADEVAAASGLDPRRAVLALERLAAGGLVEQAADTDGRGGPLRAAGARFKDAAREAGAARRAADAQEHAADFGDRPADAAAVLRNFVAGGRLLRIPAQRTKRRVVLDWLAERFEPGHVYPEREVNALLGTAHDDVAALRRYLVDEEFLERRDQFYWRAGGTFDVEPDV